MNKKKIRDQEPLGNGKLILRSESCFSSITASPMLLFDRLKKTRSASGKSANSPSPLPIRRLRKAQEKTPTPKKVSSDEESESEHEVKKSHMRTRRQSKINPHGSDSEEDPTPKTTPTKKFSPKSKNANTEIGKSMRMHEVVKIRPLEVTSK